jgi:hypothetical protein
MADLLIRDIDPRLKRELEDSARKNSNTLSEEAKLLIRRALSVEADTRKLGTLMSQLIPPEYRSDDFVFEVPGEISPPPDFE